MSGRHGGRSESADGEADQDGGGVSRPDSGMEAVIDDVEERTAAMISRLKERLPHKGGKSDPGVQR